MDDEIRVSAVCLCRIQNAQSEYLLGINLNRLTAHNPILMPLGGAYQYTSDAVISQWVVTYEDPYKSELRFITRQQFLPSIEKWYLLRQQRELTPYRELYEELVQEYRVLPDLTADELEMNLSTTVISRRVTDRHGMRGTMTQYFIELFDVQFRNPEHQHRLHTIRPESGLYWIPSDAITRGLYGEEQLRVDAKIILPAASSQRVKRT